jgi:hypothetical protein
VDGCSGYFRSSLASPWISVIEGMLPIPFDGEGARLQRPDTSNIEATMAKRDLAATPLSKGKILG